jgi:hypothetical protein
VNFGFNYFAKFVGHLAQDCFHSKGGKIYELVPDEEDTRIPSEDTEDSRKRKKVRFIISFIAM